MRDVEPDAVTGSPGALPSGLELAVRDLHKSFDGQPVLVGVDFKVRSGEVVAIAGGSGCGKTVLLGHLLGQHLPDSGQVFAADHDAPGAPMRDLALLDDDEVSRLRQRWGVVFQRNALFSGTVRDNIALWLREVRDLEEAEIDVVAHEVLAAVHLPESHLLDRHVESLSGGMAKRLAIARALSMDPIVMFYDEPTTGLDPSSAALIHDLIFETHHEARPDGALKTTVIITHDMDLLKRLRPRILLLHEGRVHFDGLFKSFRASDSPIVRPYLKMMPVLQSRARRPG